MSNLYPIKTLADYQIGDPLPELTYSEYTEIHLTDTNYHLLAGPGGPFIIKNKSGYPIYLIFNGSANTIENSDEEYLIGGITSEKVTDIYKYTWIRSSKEDIKIAVRPAGTFDPTENIESLGNLLNSLLIRYNNHEISTNNPHQVTKAQVGLDNIPNAKSDNVENNNSEVLATTALTHKIQTQLDEHEAKTDNPHQVTKEQVGLGLVDNYPTTDHRTLSDCLDTVTDKFVNPAAAHRIARMAAMPAEYVCPQCVVVSPTGDRATDWLVSECDAPPTHTVRVDNTHVRINKNIRVSYTYNSKVLISEPLDNDIQVFININTGEYYVYVDVNAEGFITGAGNTELPPIFDYQRNGNVGDFFNIATCNMYDANDNQIRRVYIARVIVDRNAIQDIIPVPIGTRYIVPLTNDLVLSARYILDNPFMTKLVNVSAEVIFRNGWQQTEWNDQIGIKASVHPALGDTQLVVQCGQMGFLACGRESGSSFGSSFNTITSSMRTRIVIERKF